MVMFVYKINCYSLQVNIALMKYLYHGYIPDNHVLNTSIKYKQFSRIDNIIDYKARKLYFGVFWPSFRVQPLLIKKNTFLCDDKWCASGFFISSHYYSYRVFVVSGYTYTNIGYCCYIKQYKCKLCIIRYNAITDLHLRRVRPLYYIYINIVIYYRLILYHGYYTPDRECKHLRSYIMI